MNRRVNLKDVAAEAGVSYQTVSKVLNGRAQVAADTAARVWDAARKLGYRPHVNARNLRTRRSRMIGYSWVPGTGSPDQSNHILDLFLVNMVEEAEGVGYHLLPFSYREGDDEVSGYRELIDSGKIDGFVLTSVNYDDPRIRFLMERQFPFVAFGRSSADMDFPYVDVDGAAGLRMATDYLIARGHRRIAALAWPEHSRVGNDRMAGYFAAMAVAGIEVQKAWIARGSGSFDFARTAADRLLDLGPEERPTAIVALNDTMAIGAMNAAMARGIEVGRDLAVIGFDDVPMAQYLWPPLTSIRQPVREAGHKCVDILVTLLEGKAPAERQVLLQPELIVRASA